MMTHVVNGRPFGTSAALFEKFSAVAEGFHPEQIADAALNLLMRELLYRNPDAEAAAGVLSALMVSAERHLTDCYEQAGRKKIYPYTRLTG
jgi:hypothetical protein